MKLQFTRIIMSILFAILFVTAAQAVEKRFPFNATVRELDTNQAIPGVVIELYRISPAKPKVEIKLVSDLEGKAQALLPAGSYRAVVQKPGYAVEESRFESPAQEGSTTVLYGLAKEAVVSGRLLDEQGKPVSGLTVSLDNKQSAVSDTSGAFRIEGLGRGYKELRVSNQFLVFERFVRFSINPGETKNLGDLAVRKGGLVAITVSGIEKGKKSPLKKLHLSVVGNQGERYGRTDDKGTFLVDALPPGSYNVNSYDERIVALTAQEIIVKEGERSEVKLEAVMRPSEVYLDDFGDVLLPDTPVKVRVGGFRALRAELKVSEIDPSILAKKDFNPEEKPVSEVHEQKLIKKITLKLKGNKGNLYTRGRFELPPLKPGVYSLEVRDLDATDDDAGSKKIKKRRKSTKLVFLVTRLALVAKMSPTGTVVHAVDLVTGKSLPNVDISEYSLSGDMSKPVHKAKTDDSGMAAWPGAEKGSMIVGRLLNSYAFLRAGGERNRDSEAHKGYIYTERPVYRPGQTVYFKGVLRKRAGEGYSLPNADKAKVTIVDNQDQTVFEKEFAVSSTGSINGEFILPQKPALGGYGISISFNDKKWEARFKVLEYRKPEFEVIASTPQKYVLAGDKTEVDVKAKYYFGAPVVGATIRYRLYSKQVYSFGYEDEGGEDYGEEEYYGGGYADFIGEGEVKTDAEGLAKIAIETRPTKTPLLYTVEMDVTDQSSRQVSSSAGFTVVPSLISVSLRSQTYLSKPEQPVDILVKAATWEGEPVKTGLKVTVEEQIYDKKSYKSSFRTIDTLETSTDATGQGNFRYAFPRPGNWRMTAATIDRRGKEASGHGWIWVWREGYAWDTSYREMGVEFDKKSYKPGDTARIIVKNPAPGGHLLFSVEGREIYSRKVVPLNSSVQVIELPIAKEYAPYVQISANMVHKGRFYTRNKRLVVDYKADLLKVKVTPDKDIYSPGETVKLSMATTGNDDKSRSAELSLGVVDEAIYAVAKERSDDIYTVFRGSREILVSTLHSFPRVYLGGAAKSEQSAANEKQQAQRVRRVFKDTAFWLPTVRTDADGKASTEFVLPDNLTTWRTTAIGHTDASEFGTGTSKFLARLDVMARLLPPRYMIQGDELKVPAMINNVTGKELKTTGRFSSEKMKIVGDPAFTGTVPANGSLRRNVAVKAESTGEGIMRVEASAGSKGDAMEIAVPILARGLKRKSVGNIVIREAGKGEITIDYPKEAFSEGAMLSINVAPNLFASLNGSINELVQFPYGCVEQTMSRFLPAMYVKHVAETGSRPLDKELSEKIPKVLEAGLERLYDFQHEDGGWGWWKEDATDSNMTAYVVYGMALAKKGGVELKEGVFEKGLKALKEITEKGPADRLPFAYRAMTLAGLSDSKAEETVEKGWSRLEPSEKMLYIEALLNRGEKVRASKLLEGIKANAQREGSAAWIKDRDADSWWYSHRWAGSAVESTAMLLENLLRIDSTDSLAPALAEFLIRKRAGNWWNTTRATAMVIKSLSDYSAEGGTYNARLLLNDKEIAKINVENGIATSGGTGFSIVAAELKRGINRLRIEKSAPSGAAHLSAVLDYYVSPDVASSSPGLSIERNLYRLKTRRDGDKHFIEYIPLKPEEKLDPGEDIEVRLVVNNKDAMEFVIIEDPLPAGFEVRETKGDSRFDDYSGYSDWYAHRERHDERMAFFMNNLYSGRHEFRYIVHPEIEGSVIALPASIWAMYMPTIRAESRSWEVRVEK